MGKYHYFLEMDLFLDTEKGGEKDIWNQKRTRENYNRSRNKWTTNGDAEEQHGKHASYDAASDGAKKKGINHSTQLNIPTQNSLCFILKFSLSSKTTDCVFSWAGKQQTHIQGFQKY